MSAEGDTVVIIQLMSEVFRKVEVRNSLRIYYKSLKTMEWNPYISGALTAIVFLNTYHFLPKKLKSWKRYVVAIIITVPIILLIRFIFDWFNS